MNLSALEFREFQLKLQARKTVSAKHRLDIVPLADTESSALTTPQGTGISSPCVFEAHAERSASGGGGRRYCSVKFISYDSAARVLASTIIP